MPYYKEIKLTEEQKSKYLSEAKSDRTLTCPHCGCSELEKDELDSYGTTVITRSVTCLGCDRIWVETFELTQIREPIQPSCPVCNGKILDNHRVTTEDGLKHEDCARVSDEHYRLTGRRP